MNTIKVSLVQMISWDNKEANFQKAMGFANQALKDKPDIICFSESFLYWGPADAWETLESPYVHAFKEFAKKNKVNIVLWSIKFRSMTPHKFTNTALILDRTWDIVYQYDKIYMFYVNRPDIIVRESDTTSPGNSLWLFELEGVKIGVGVCYDLRYPEYFQALARKWAEVIFLPAHFRKKTWSVAREVLTKSRAIENQVYFCACGDTGEWLCGDSRILSYDGQELAALGSEEGVITATLDLQALKTFRRDFPVLLQIKNFNV